MADDWAFDITPPAHAGAERTFQSTGPQGHRGRMRTRLLGAGPDGLADYELIEMLLFLGIPRRDTKPFAKALINRFGDLLRTLTAKPDALAAAGLNDASQRAWAMVQEAGQRLVRADSLSRPLLNAPEKLLAYLDLPQRLSREPHLAVLFLNNRNQLLAEESWPEDVPAEALCGDIARHVVQVHATALILVRSRPGTRPKPSKADRGITEHCRRMADILSLALHDHLIIGQGEPFSFRGMRLL